MKKVPLYRDLAAAGVLLLVVLLFFGGTVFLRPDPVIAVSGKGEMFTIYMPFRIFGAEQLKSGEFPLWNPYVSSGVPFFSNREAAVLYPLNWIYIFLPVAAAVNIGLMVHMFLGGAFMYAWVRSRSVRPEAALLSAGIFMFCAPQILYVHGGQLSNFYTLVWSPLILLSVDKLCEDGRLRWVLLGVFAVSMQILAGHTQYLFYTAIAALLYFCMRVFSAKGSPPAEYLKKSSRFLGVYAAAAALTAVQLLPALDMAGESIRGRGIEYEFASSFSFPPENFITFLSPGFFGDGLRFPYWGRWFFWEVTAFAGVAGLLLAAVAVSGWRRKEKRYYLITALACSVLAMGAYTPLFKVLYRFVPGFDLFRGNGKFIFLTVMFLSVLSGAGFGRLLEAIRDRGPAITARLKRGALIFLVCAALPAVAAVLIYPPGQGEASPVWGDYIGNLSGEQRPEYFEEYAAYPVFRDKAALNARNGLLKASGIALLLAVALFLSVWKRKALFAAGIIALLEIALFGWAYRAETMVPDLRAPPGIREFFDGHPGDYRVFWPGTYHNGAMIDRMNVLWGDALLPSRRYAEFMFHTQGRPPRYAGEFLVLERYNDLYGLLRCRYIVAGEKLRVEGEKPVFAGAGVKIYRTGHDLPRAVLIDRYKVIGDRDGILSEISKASFRPGEEVVLEEEPEPRPEKGAGPPGKVEVLRASANRLDIRADLYRPAILLVTDNYYKGWRVLDTTGGKTVPRRVLPADHILRAVPLAKGEHLIRMYYFPDSLRTGIVISLVTLLFLVSVILAAMMKKRW